MHVHILVKYLLSIFLSFQVFYWKFQLLDGKGKFILWSCCSIMVDILAWLNLQLEPCQMLHQGWPTRECWYFSFHLLDSELCSWFLLTNVINGWHSYLPGEHVTQGRVRWSEGCWDFPFGQTCWRTMDMCHVKTALQLLGPCVALTYAGYTTVIPTKLHTTNFVREHDQWIHHGNT